MSNLHRIQWIDIRIRSHKYPNCTDIANEFCLSRRQASRDVEYLRYSLGAPVEFSQEKNGYYYTDEAFILPAVMITHDEKAALSYLSEQYKSVSGQMAAQLATLFARLSGDTIQQPEKPVIPVYRIGRNALEIIQILKDALALKKKVQLTYINSGNIRSARVVHPYKIFMKKNVQYLAAYYEKSGEVRIFKINRIQEGTLCNEPFLVQANFQPDMYDDKLRFNFRLPYTAVIRFNHPVNLPADNHKWVALNDGSYGVAFYKSHELFHSLIGIGAEFIILNPEWLKTKFYKYFSSILEKNRY